MSRLAAIREYSYMQALHKRDFPVPEPIDQCRHGVLMTRAQGAPLYQVRELAHPQKVMQSRSGPAAPVPDNVNRPRSLQT